MRAVILAGGKGTRLKPFTTLIPKPLVPIGGESSILEIVIQQLKAQGFAHLTIAVSHLADLIMAYIGDGSRWGIKIDFSMEDRPLGTIGPLTIIPNLPDNFLVMNGDILTDLDYAGFLRQHEENGSDVTVAAYQRDAKIDFGVLRFDDRYRLQEFQEKPTFNFDVSMGVYAMSRSTIGALPRGQAYGFDDLMIDGLRNGLDIRVRPFPGFWLDVGRPEDYDYVNDHFEEIKRKLDWHT